MLKASCLLLFVFVQKKLLQQQLATVRWIQRSAILPVLHFTQLQRDRDLFLYPLWDQTVVSETEMSRLCLDGEWGDREYRNMRVKQCLHQHAGCQHIVCFQFVCRLYVKCDANVYLGPIMHLLIVLLGLYSTDSPVVLKKTSEISKNSNQQINKYYIYHHLKPPKSNKFSHLRLWIVFMIID